MKALAFIDGVGVRTATGVDALTATTTVRARKSFVRETRFVDRAGEPIALALVASIPDELIGRERFVPLAAPALAEAAGPNRGAPLPLLLAVPAEADPIDPRGVRLLASLAERSGVALDLARSKLVAQGRAGGVAAIEQAITRLAEHETILVGGVDSWFDPERLEALDDARRLHGPATENGFIPGEGAAFVRLSRRGDERWAAVTGIATEHEPRPFGSSEPCHALGISLAATRALAPLAGARIGWALTDVVGERHRTEEWLYASGRVQSSFTEDAQHETPLLLTGDLGAASATFLAAHACVSWRIAANTTNRALVAAHSDGAERGALLLETEARS
ncbi:MAG: hypothetical protein KIT84_10685 [Labilithrix sp.]|nr:hypothetical protein [Labilithrix sp.]MCW5811472.1 hypothetical protein [Labilithrix sp.]